ncbi:phosphodiester glycosidase family protein [Demequina lignilytica]|uniref:Phosphodiester glycosidase family protein n=1 Tax=Demequina lignilytica TaxID=3051663 RepID=A0AB35MDW8_9MICO|nr:phosphodiester glycosidase family protein [Demequina sp. SYSU T0a273]MDN4481955.1 phosphodiester glycosidase family protein [Demequina sp. SYSU T0a273]
MTAPTWSPAAPPEPAVAAPTRRRRLRRRIVGAIAVLLLVLGSIAAWALDRFVIDHVEIADVAAYEAAQQASTTGTTADDVTTSTASSTSTSDGADVTITQYTYGTGDDAATYYVADVTFDDITQLQSAFANNEFGTNIIADPSEIAESVGASFAINGDYYGFRDTGIEIRNGVIYRDEGARTGAVIYADGTMEIYDETATTAQELVDAGAWLTLSFGPALVDDGEIVDGIESVEVDTNVGNHSIQGDQPRTAIGMISANHYVFVVVDGRSDSSAGVTLTELAEIMADLGATEAYNLDGGGSSTMVSDGQVVNWPGGSGNERGTSDILWIG